MTNPSKYDRTVTLMCPTCGGTKFEHDEHGENSPVTCVSCNLQISRSSLIEGNGENISAQIEQVKGEVVSDIKAQLKKALKDFRIK